MNVMENVRPALDVGPASYCTGRGDPSLGVKGRKVKVTIEQAMYYVGPERE
jgi:hypothetical protein